MEWYACDIMQTVTSSTVQKFAKGVSPLFPSFSCISGCVLQVLYWSKCSSTPRKPEHILHGTTLTDAYLPTGPRPTLGITVHWPTGRSPKPDAKKIWGSCDILWVAAAPVNTLAIRLQRLNLSCSKGRADASDANSWNGVWQNPCLPTPAMYSQIVK